MSKIKLIVKNPDTQEAVSNLLITVMKDDEYAEIYTDKSLTIPYCNPIVADADGKIPAFYMKKDY